MTSSPTKPLPTMSGMKRTPLRKVSKKQRARKSAWAKVTAQRIEDVGGRCEECNRIYILLYGHHRLPARFKDDSYQNCVVLCWGCHRFVHEHPTWAKEQGFILTDPKQLEAT